MSQSIALTIVANADAGPWLIPVVQTVSAARERDALVEAFSFDGADQAIDEAFTAAKQSYTGIGFPIPASLFFGKDEFLASIARIGFDHADLSTELTDMLDTIKSLEIPVEDVTVFVSYL